MRLRRRKREKGRNENVMSVSFMYNKRSHHRRRKEIMQPSLAPALRWDFWLDKRWDASPSRAGKYILPPNQHKKFIKTVAQGGEKNVTNEKRGRELNEHGTGEDEGIKC